MLIVTLQQKKTKFVFDIIVTTVNETLFYFVGNNIFQFTSPITLFLDTLFSFEFRVFVLYFFVLSLEFARSFSHIFISISVFFFFKTLLRHCKENTDGFYYEQESSHIRFYSSDLHYMFINRLKDRIIVCSFNNGG